MGYFKAFIRVVKTLKPGDEYSDFGSVNVIREPMIEAEDKQEVKTFLLKKYPQFFQNEKIYERKTKDEAQFFYVVIYPLFNFELEMVKEGEWLCSYCNHIHLNKYVSKPRKNEKLFPGKLFCMSDDDYCLTKYKENFFKEKGIELPDDEFYINVDSPYYIYKITEKKNRKMLCRTDQKLSVLSLVESL